MEVDEIQHDRMLYFLVYSQPYKLKWVEKATLDSL